jgi:hypothetical protein
MTTNVIHAEYDHKNGGTATDSKLIKMITTSQASGMNGETKIFKFRYRAYNSGEEFYGELFDGQEFKPIFALSDLGVHPDCSAYHILSEDKLQVRIQMLTDKGILYIKKLF